MDPAPSGLLIIVPARAGSKGLPGKNLRRLGGLTLIEWTARTIARAGVGGRAIVSTEDPGIAEVSRAAGLEVPFVRPRELATDEAPMIDVVEHAVDWMERTGGLAITSVMLLQPSCPFRSARRLSEALALLARPDTNAVIGVDSIARGPGLLYREDDAGVLCPLGPWEERIRRQDIRPVFTPNGTIYLITREALRQSRRLVPPCLRGLPTTRVEAIDIDGAEDWALAEAVVAAGLATP